MKWYIGVLIFLVCIGLFIGSAHWVAFHTTPAEAQHYQQLLRKFDLEEARVEFLEHFPETYGLGWQECLDWLADKMIYPQPDNPTHQMIWEQKVQTEGRPEDPIRILESPFVVTENQNGYMKTRRLGRCGEFSLVYAQLLLVNGYVPNLVMGWWEQGDHVWVELKAVNHPWVIDPTDSATWRQTNPDKPWDDCKKISKVSYKLWGDREWDRVFRISIEDIKNVKRLYNEPE